MRSRTLETRLADAHASLELKDPNRRATEPKAFVANLSPDHPAHRLEFNFGNAETLAARRLGRPASLASLGVLFYDLEEKRRNITRPS